MRDIVAKLKQAPANPVLRARLMVERQVPPARRGPGWDRHWRELEAYLHDGIEWHLPQSLDDTPPDEVKKKAGPKTSL